LYDTTSAVTISIAMEHKLWVRNCDPNNSTDAEIYERLKPGAAFAHLICRPGYQVEDGLFFAEVEDAGAVGFINVLPEPGIGRVVLEYEIDSRFSVAPILTAMVDIALRYTREMGAKLAHVSLNSTAVKDVEVLANLGFKEVRRYQELRLELSQLAGIIFEAVDLRFRHLQQGEEAKLAEIENCCFEGSWGFNPNTVDYVSWELKVKRNNYDDIILAKENDDIIGYCWLVTSSNGDSIMGKGRIYMLGVRPNRRGKGLGRKLILAGLQHLKDVRSEIVEITVDRQNIAALDLYRSIGFQPTEDIVWYEKIID
jgi:mycothiol synthase